MDNPPMVLTEAPFTTLRAATSTVLDWFQNWLAAAKAIDPIGAEALAIATASRGGRPSNRMVLLKGVSERGIVFVSSYESRKGAELAANPQGAALFYWQGLRRQVRFEGVVSQIAPEESDAYWESRPRESQISASASAQSHPVDSRESLEAAAEQIRVRFVGKPIPRPATWGGYLLTPDRIEFWRSMPDRLHDRVEYLAEGDRWVGRLLGP